MAANNKVEHQEKQGMLYQGRNLRRGRVSETGRAYLITTVIQDRTPLFLDMHLGRQVVAALRHEEKRAETLCFVVMPDHLHWLLILKGGSLSASVRNVKSGSARLIRNAHTIRGPIWQKGFHDRAVRDNQDLKPLARYIVANPVRAGLVETIGDYPLWDAAWL